MHETLEATQKFLEYKTDTERRETENLLKYYLGTQDARFLI